MKSKISSKKISIKSKISKISFLFCIIVFGLVFVNTSALASVKVEKPQKESIYIDKATIKKGYTVTAFDEKLKLSLVPEVFKGTTRVNAEVIDEEMPLPWKLDKISPIYQFDFSNQASYNHDKPFYIQFSYPEKSDRYKQVFFYDKNHEKWRPLPTTDFPNENFVRSLIHLPFARIAVFSNPEVMANGRASWYAYKGGDFAASPDFPKGSRVRVINEANEKFVDVEINDYGPDRSIFPERVIDLDKEAFAKVASPGEGIIDVRVEPIYIPKEDRYSITAVKNGGAEISPSIGAKAGIIIDARNGQVVWEKDSQETLPLASLSKLVALKVFLEQDIPLEKEVFYKKQDEIYNHEYCKPWESAKIGLREGDIVKIKDLIYASLVGSANNAVESLVRVSPLSRDEFIKKMNDYAQSLGAKTTYFEEPTGLSTQNVSSAYDYAIITKEVFKEPIIEKASSKANYRFTTINTDREFNLKNTNSMISDKVNLNKGIDVAGSKTGYLDGAGYCLVVKSGDSKGNSLISLIMNSPTRDGSFDFISDLVRYGFKEIK